MIEQTLRIGDVAWIKRGWIYKRQLVYAGMPGDSVFSLVVMITEAHNSWSYNLFVPTDQREITVAGALVTVLSHSPEEIRIRIAA